MSRIGGIAVLLFSLLLPADADAQATGSVVGRVVDRATQQPIAGVQVFVVGTTRGTLTDSDGRYRLGGLDGGQVSVRALIIGYEAQTQTVTVPTAGAATANFVLGTSAIALDAVTVNAVTGQAERRRELGTNVGNINVGDLPKGPITKVSDVLMARTTGVNVQGVAGTTGTSQRIRIRGANSISLSNEPLVYVDGVLFSNSTGFLGGAGGQDVSRLNDLNPEDIQSIEVLKGPAASALYGTAAANGVLLITTKRGRSGRVAWNAYVETGNIEDKNDYPLNYLSYTVRPGGAGQSFTTPTGAFNSAARSPCFNFRAALATGAPGACVQDSTVTFNTLRDARTTPFVEGYRRKFGLNVSGGSDVFQYYISGDMEDEQGVIDYNTMNKASVRGNFSAQVRRDLRLSASVGYVDNSLDLNSNDNSIFSPLINGLLGGAIFFPGTSTPDTILNFRNFGFGFSQRDLRHYVAEQDVDRFTGGLNADFRPFNWLTANFNIGLDLTDRHDYRTLQPNRLPIAQSFTVGNRTSERANTYLYNGNGSVQATFSPTASLVSTTTAGFGYNRNLFERTEGFGAGIVAGTANLGGTTSLFSVDEDFSEVITVGGYVREQLAWKDRVFLAGSVRGDDNSAFGVDYGFVYYPSLSLSWVVADEPWFPQIRQLSSFRLRAAYGTSGLRPDFRDAQTFFTTAAVSVAGANVPGVTLSNTGNTDLKPERTTEIEIGGDLGLFGDRVSVDFTHFTKESRDALISRRLPPSFGLTASVFDNLGRVRNWGTELGINANVFESRNFGLDMRISATTLDNRIEELGEGVAPIIFNRGNQGHVEGYPTGAFFQREIVIDDADNNGLLAISEVTLGDTALASQFVGPALPKFSRSLWTQVTAFRYITISTLFDWRGGNYQLNETESFRCARGFAIGDRGCRATGDPTASLDEQARFIADIFRGSGRGYVEKADFVKWRELAVTLGTPEWVANRVRALRGASLTLSGRNLKTWTDYSGLDPEVNESGGGANFSQNEFNTQPPVRYYTARLNFVF